MRIRITDTNKTSWEPWLLARRITDIILGSTHDVFISPQGHVPEGFDSQDWQKPADRYQLGRGNNYWLNVKGEREYELHFRYNTGEREIMEAMVVILNRFCAVNAELD